MSVLSREAAVDTFGQAGDEKRIGTTFGATSETGLWAACLAVALFVPDGYPQLVAYSVLGVCSLAWIARVCQCD